MPERLTSEEWLLLAKLARKAAALKWQDAKIYDGVAALAEYWGTHMPHIEAMEDYYEREEQ